MRNYRKNKWLLFLVKIGHQQNILPVVDDSIKIYISSYGSHSVAKKLNCNICRLLIVEDKGKTVGDVYFDHLQRGGHSIPTEEVITSFIHAYAIM